MLRFDEVLLRLCQEMSRILLQGKTGKSSDKRFAVNG